MSPSKSKFNQLPADASSYRSHHHLQVYKERLKAASEKPKVPPAPVPPQEPCDLLNDSILLSPGKDFFSTVDDLHPSPPKPDILALYVVPEWTTSAVTEAMKNAYVASMKDLRKGFPAVCDLVTYALTAVMSCDNMSHQEPVEGAEAVLIAQRFWVDCEGMKRRYNVPLVTVTEVVAEEEEKGQEENEEEKPKDEAPKFHAKRCRRYHFQVLLRIALFKMLWDRRMIEASVTDPTFQKLLKDVVELVRAVGAIERFDYIWKFMETDIQYRCGNDPAVRLFISEVCDELLLPLPDYDEPLQKKPPKGLIRMTDLPAAKLSQPQPTMLQRSQSAFQPRRSSSQLSLEPMDSKRSFHSLPLAFGRHRFSRQRSAVEYGPNQSMSRQSSQTSLKPVVALFAKEQSLVRVKRSLFSDNQPHKVREFLQLAGSEPMLTTQSLTSAQKAAIGRSTPFREQRERARSGKSPLQPAAGTLLSITEYSPFKKAGNSGMPLSDQVMVRQTEIMRTRRQLDF